MNSPEVLQNVPVLRRRETPSLSDVFLCDDTPHDVMTSSFWTCELNAGRSFSLTCTSVPPEPSRNLPCHMMTRYYHECVIIQRRSRRTSVPLLTSLIAAVNTRSPSSFFLFSLFKLTKHEKQLSFAQFFSLIGQSSLEALRPECVCWVLLKEAHWDGNRSRVYLW